MIDAKKLNDTIISLEDEVENIKKISSIAKDLERISNKAESNQNLYGELLDKSRDTRDGQIKTIARYEQLLNDLKNTIGEENKNFNLKIQEVKEENDSFNKALNKSYCDMENILLTQIQETRNESKRLYLEFEDILGSKLDRTKSDIQVEIREDISKIKDDNEAIVTSKINEIKSEVKIYNEEINRKINRSNILLIALIVLSSINIVIRFI